MNVNPVFLLHCKKPYSDIILRLVISKNTDMGACIKVESARQETFSLKLKKRVPRQLPGQRGGFKIY